MNDHISQGPRYSVRARDFFSQHRRSREERRAVGESTRDRVPLAHLAALPDSGDRVDPLDILRGQESSRDAALVPLRYERMSVDSFAFLRGGAAIMARDLSTLPTSGIRVQLCGDAHLANFGLFASAERTLVFDVNDFDETLPGPFDWDVRRLSASAAVAALALGMSEKKARKAAKAAANAYRTVMLHLSTMPTLAVWNLKIDSDFLVDHLGKSGLRKVTLQATSKSKRSTSELALIKLTELVDGRRRFRSRPPLLLPLTDEAREEAIDRMAPAYERYLRTLAPDRVALLSHYSFVDLAQKVVGVGSVGTLALVLLLESGDGEPLILQIKQADASVLEPYLGSSQFDNSGKRVVVGQRVMQATGDPFLGWVSRSAESRHDFYVRQLKDMKSSIDVTLLDADSLSDYAAVCGATLARAHARVGDSSMIAGYLGATAEFEAAMADFAMGYAAITAADHARLVSAGVASRPK